MKFAASLIIGALAPSAAGAASLLVNGNLDRTYAQEIVTGFFLPKPSHWVNEASRTIAGPYEDEMSSEPWAGPAPTPVTTDGNLNDPPPAGFGGPDGGETPAPCREAGKYLIAGLPAPGRRSF